MAAPPTSRSIVTAARSVSRSSARPASVRCWRAGSRSAAAVRSGPCWPTTWRGPASGTIRDHRPRLHRDPQPSAPDPVRRAGRRATTCPRPRRPRGSSGRSTARSQIEPVVTDIDHTNILDLVGDADLILDGTDNFETRYLINDAAVKLGKPWIYGGVIGSEGQTMTIVPGKTPCLRCLIETAPPPGMTPTCETAGVLGPAVAVIASFEAIEAIKLLTGAHDALNRDLIMVDVWDWTFRQLKVAGLLGKVDCPCCEQRRFEWLEGGMGSHTTTLCGRNAVQVAVRRPEPSNFAELARRLEPSGRRSGTTRSCSGSPPRATSSPSSPTAGRSSRGPMTSPRRGRCMRSLWGAEEGNQK